MPMENKSLRDAVVRVARVSPPVYRPMLQPAQRKPGPMGPGSNPASASKPLSAKPFGAPPVYRPISQTPQMKAAPPAYRPDAFGPPGPYPHGQPFPPVMANGAILQMASKGKSSKPAKKAETKAPAKA